MFSSAQHAYPRMQLRTASGKSKSTTQKLVMTVNFYQTVNQNNLSIKKIKFIKFIECCSTIYSPETSKIIIVHQGCNSGLLIKRVLVTRDLRCKEDDC